ncbi:MAG: hypothetical protein R3273_05170 [Pseudidiomarina maritima]|nr:hypothetical protein [Pseudidiomarina maritima]
MKNTIVGVDLTKHVIQGCSFSNKTEQANIDITPAEFAEWLTVTTSETIVFEALCVNLSMPIA